MHSTQFEEDLAGRLEKLTRREGVELEREVRTRLAGYVALLFRWNERMNLTALDAGDRGLERLIVEPLIAARCIPAAARTMVDIGSGGGSPAIPVKIARPELFLRMVESRTRRAAFLRETVRRLKLAGTRVENCRFGALADRPDMWEAHDVLSVRGVRVDGSGAGKLQEMVKPHGVLLVFCSEGQGSVSRNMRAPLRVEGEVALPGASGSRLVVIRKACVA